MKVRLITGVSALALMLSAAPVLAQSAQDNNQQRHRQNQNVSQPWPGSQGEPNAAPPQTSGQGQQNAQQPRTSGSDNQRNANQPAQGQQQGAQNAPSHTGQAQQGGAQQQSSSNTGQAQQQTSPSNQQNAQQPPQQNQQQGARQSAPATGQAQQQGTQPSQRNAEAPQQPMQQRVTLNTQQQTKVRQAVARLNLRPLSSVNFSLRVGTAVPASVRLQSLPSQVVEILPQYRGYDFVLVSDQIVVIDPSTRQIVTTLAYEASSAHAQAPAQNRRVAKFSDEQRAAVRKSVTAKSRTSTGPARERTRVVVGDEVPSSVELESFPETIYREVPAVREYRYYRDDANVIVVDPGERRVIEVIE
jgi:hypothetical protein